MYSKISIFSLIHKNSSKALTEFRNDLVCQICRGHARPGKKQWYRCLDLHPICQDCKVKNEKCSCDGGHTISNEFCKMTEKLLSVVGMKYNCFNTKNGCQEVLAETALEDHESSCIYRVVQCLRNALLAPCTEKVTFREVIQHYEDHGKVKLTEGNLKMKHRNTCSEFYLDISGGNRFFPPLKFSLNNQTFLLFHKTEEKIVHLWVYMLGSPNEAKHFSYTLKLFGPNTTLTIDGKVAAIDESFDTLSAAGKCFAYSHKNFIAQVLNENRYEYSLEIRNLKEEAKDENYESGISDNDEDSKE